MPGCKRAARRAPFPLQGENMDWFPWYPTLYEAKTLHLTVVQDCIYRRLIDWYMAKRQPLPDHDIAIANAARVSLTEWLDNADVLRAFFTTVNGLLHLRRCDAELERQDRRTTKLSEVGRKGAEKRWLKAKGLIADPMPTLMPFDATRHVEDKTEIDSPPLYSPPPTANTEGRATRSARCASLKANKQEVAEAFTTFWQAYPRKVGKRKAESLFYRLIDKGEATASELLAGAEAYNAVTLARDTEPQYIAHPATWLNRGSWLDERPAKSGNGELKQEDHEVPIYGDYSNKSLQNKWRFWTDYMHQEPSGVGYHTLCMLAAEIEHRGLAVTPPIAPHVAEEIADERGKQYRLGKHPGEPHPDAQA